MQGQHLYEYAIIRVVPRVEREEFINAGVILCDAKSGFIGAKIQLNEQKLLALDPEADVEMIKLNLSSFEKICSGNDGGQIADMDLASRFRWLTAVRSSIIQTSRPHTGFSSDLAKTLEKLFEENVL
ncbi:MAG: DUF3037 domain-containing protein [Roseivirga sp.]|jgi:hypothetical protein|uniref:DUF3037 domain-containing protein n=1 Tax=Roseivirga sp. TaxID=1964215 RepID=UPI001B1E66AC|nr:DUF3037 domain-containing protein [Roseivirga sp.]MBO6495329.1 DUF3037 domain-containing protein [Roseivirga sp.]MBO6660448.1 DUF3037 domain-containing protein [Roseivirga sp.]MBO6762948.1 DUF3037 domain-containing protein [Roseivirga sp.]MBO6906815.1 DUF3037 domain-containing protein [Roseivirga sp.]